MKKSKQRESLGGVERGRTGNREMARRQKQDQREREKYKR